MSHEILLRQLELGSQDKPFVLVGVLKTEGPTAVKVGNKAIILSDGTVEGWVGGHCTEHEILSNALDSLKDGIPRTLNLSTCHGGQMDVYLEPYLPKRKLIVAGHVPIVSALSKLARSLNFSVLIVDKLASKERFPEADGIVDSVEDLAKRWKIAPGDSYAVVATMGEGDQAIASELLKLKVAYVGIVAGKKRATELLSYLKGSGISEEEMAKVRTPAGIYIRAVTSEEIALSIMAEIVETARMGSYAQTESRRVSDKSEQTGIVHTPAGATSSSGSFRVDPVCGMVVEISPDPQSAKAPLFSISAGRKVHFCSEACKEVFDSNPAIYVVGE